MPPALAVLACRPMWRLLLLGLGAAACRSSTAPGTAGTALVHVELGNRPTGGITVVSHGDAGAIVETDTTDGTGLATVGIDRGGLVTAVLPGTPIHLATTQVKDGDEITIVGPPMPPPALVVGTLHVVAPGPLAGVQHVAIDLGCTTIDVASLPATVDVIGACLGSDTNLDVVVRAIGASGTVGYLAGRVPLVAGAAEFSPPAWSTAVAPIPMSLGGVTPTAVAWSVIADGQVMYTASQPGIPDGLVADQARIAISVDRATTTLTYSSVPAQITLTADDLLAPLAAQPMLAGARFAWTAPMIGDVVDLAVRWPNLAWDAALPPTADHVALPALDGLDTSGTLAATLRAIDSSELTAPPTELHVDSEPATIVPLPAAGMVRETAETANGATRAPHAR